MAKFSRNCTYLCRKADGKKWYIVHQSGQRSWTATVFTHVQTLDDEDSVITMNGTALYSEFENGKIHAFYNNTPHKKKMRELMFNILKWGQEKEPKDSPR